MGDLLDLCKYFPTVSAFKNVRGILDTNKLYKYMHPDIIHQDVSLKNLTKKFLHCDLKKNIQCSDWGRRPLTSDQIKYAACDSLVLLRLFDAMTSEAMRKNNMKTFPLSDVVFNFEFDTYISRKAGTARFVNLISNDASGILSDVLLNPLIPVVGIKKIEDVINPSSHIHFMDLEDNNNNKDMMIENHIQFNENLNDSVSLPSSEKNDLIITTTSPTSGNQFEDLDHVETFKPIKSRLNLRWRNLKTKRTLRYRPINSMKPKSNNYFRMWSPITKEMNKIKF